MIYDNVNRITRSDSPWTDINDGQDKMVGFLGWTSACPIGFCLGYNILYSCPQLSQMCLIWKTSSVGFWMWRDLFFHFCNHLPVGKYPKARLMRYIIIGHGLLYLFVNEQEKFKLFRLFHTVKKYFKLIL